MMEQLTPVRSLFEDTKRFDGKTVKVGGWVRNLYAPARISASSTSPTARIFRRYRLSSARQLANFQEISKLNISAAADRNAVRWS